MRKILLDGDVAAYLTVASPGEYFGLYFPEHGSPPAIAGLLLAVTPKIDRKTFAAGQAAADLCAACSPAVRVRLIAPGKAVPQSSFYYDWDLDPPRGYTVLVKRRDGGACPTLFSGRFDAFADWAGQTTGLEAAVGKVVTFVYEGGSSPGAKRTVRVEKVGREASGVVLEGLDMAVADLSAAYRRYQAGKIKGGIEVLN